MNIEESIDNVKFIIGDLKASNYNQTFIQAIENLLTAYEKEKEENVKLRLQDIPFIEGELKAYKDRVNELKQEIEKEKEKNKLLEENYSSAHEDINWFCENYISKEESKQKEKKAYIDGTNIADELCNKMWKNKIKAKIEPRLKELDEQMKEEYNKYGNSREYQDMIDEYNFLQSLLEKE